jgi:hypothetical protein
MAGATSGPRPPIGRSGTWATWARPAVVAFIVVAVLVLIGKPKSSPPAYLPSSTAANGTKALALLLGSLGGQVVTSGRLPAPGTGTALLLQDQLSARRRAALLAWVRSGGRLVVADPGSPLVGASVVNGPINTGPLLVSGSVEPGCSQPWVAGVGEIDASAIPAFRVPDGWHGCFGQGPDQALVMSRPVGAGQVLAVTSPTLWTNKHLPEAANAVLATNLLLGAKRADIAWLVPPRHPSSVGAGSLSLWSLVPSRVKDGLLLGVLAAVVLVLSKARRLGRPVAEAGVLQIGGSELTLATAYLWQRAGRPARAASVLKADLRHSVADRLGQTRSTTPEILSTLAAQRTGMEREQILATLDGAMPTTDDALGDLARDATELLGRISDGP